MLYDVWLLMLQFKSIAHLKLLMHKFFSFFFFVLFCFVFFFVFFLSGIEVFATVASSDAIWWNVQILFASPRLQFRHLMLLFKSVAHVKLLIHKFY